MESVQELDALALVVAEVAVERGGHEQIFEAVGGGGGGGAGGLFLGPGGGAERVVPRHLGGSEDQIASLAGGLRAGESAGSARDGRAVVAVELDGLLRGEEGEAGRG